jgi:hypothetical protein
LELKFNGKGEDLKTDRSGRGAETAVGKVLFSLATMAESKNGLVFRKEQTKGYPMMTNLGLYNCFPTFKYPKSEKL